MARQYTQNLKLILDDNLTSTARANLEKIDSLGDAFFITSSENLDIRATNTINLRPNASDVSVSGNGGIINFGNSAQELTAFNAYAALASFTGSVTVADTLSLQSGLYTFGLKAGSMTGNLLYTLPASEGTNGQALITDGSGTLSWATIGGGSNPEYHTTWQTSDGTTKTITHNLATTDILVTIKENSTNDLIHISSLTITNSNTITLVSSEAPGAGDWTVYILAN